MCAPELAVDEAGAPSIGAADASFFAKKDVIFFGQGQALVGMSFRRPPCEGNAEGFVFVSGSSFPMSRLKRMGL